ncbi:thioredoxin-like domain-containing protein [Chitinophaga rhizophila]|uniref:Metallophosphoesterase n=1 Tax=Chitinophaga rhizophila TaxID=2866212 RepID=A0ABS7GF62_9BACT|nr:thioredoxin-like domain-containing protein [Chitinophaga rhizophila]MBW8686328.1 metallophosphoesterase [Chitinophaga rhizophila]
MRFLSMIIVGMIFFYISGTPLSAMTSSTLRILRQDSSITVTYQSESDCSFQSSFIKVLPVDVLHVSDRSWRVLSGKCESGLLKWEIKAKEPIYVVLDDIIKSKVKHKTILEPGDSVFIIGKTNGHILVSGKGSNNIILPLQIDSVLSLLKKPSNPKDIITVSLHDYFEWNNYLNNQLEKGLKIFDSFKGKLSDYAYSRIKAEFLDQNLDDRSDKFGSFLSMCTRKADIPKKDICEIYDTTYFPVASKYYPMISREVFGTWKPIMFEAIRKYSFDFDDASINTKTKRHLLYYGSGTAKLKDKVRELFIQELITKYFISDLGFTAETEEVLANYYKEPGYPEYKRWLKQFELNRRELLNQKSAIDFRLVNKDGKVFTKEDFKGKVSIFDFWFTGCEGCLQMVPAMKAIEKRFQLDSNIVFVNVSIDRDKTKWLESIRNAKYTTGSGLNLYTAGEGDSNEMIRNYGIHGYPSLLLLDPWGKMINSHPKPDPRSDSGKSLINILESYKGYMNDGPYLLYENDSAFEYVVVGNKILKTAIQSRKTRQILVKPGINDKFIVRIKDSLPNEPCIFSTPGKMLILSDIEGEYDALKKLLIANRVIDQNYNWIFEDGHLVFNGDMFDRGKQVSECLWLIYSLEQKAKSAGGYVHFILGNHEIMNLRGDDRYSHVKYAVNRTILNKSQRQLYSKDSELGRWLRTKNIMEKIGNIMFVHGGIGKEFTDSVPLPIEEVNNLFRENIDVIQPKGTYARMIFSPYYSPFWFRLYYDDKDKHLTIHGDTVNIYVQHPTDHELSNILTKWNVDKIITGHTIVNDTVSSHYNGRVINTDTRHAHGQSEALLVEGSEYLRVNQKGDKRYLFKSSFSERKVFSGK